MRTKPLLNRIKPLDVESQKLKDITQLSSEGLYLRVIEALDEFEEKEAHSKEEQLFCYILRSNMYYEIGRIAEANFYLQKNYSFYVLFHI